MSFQREANLLRYGALKKRLHHSDHLGRTMHTFHVTDEDFDVIRDDTNYAVNPTPVLFVEES